MDLPLPIDPVEIAGIVRHHSPDIAGDLEPVACLMRGMSPATIAMLVREARRDARKHRRPIHADDLRVAVVLARGGDDRDDRIAALHEAAHATIGVLLGCDVQSATIDGQPATSTRFATIHATRDYVERHIVMCLAARRADAMLGGGVTAGGAVDLAQATSLARQALTLWGMGSTILSDETAFASRAVRGDVEALLDACDLRAAKLVDAHRAAILRVADALLDRRFLDGAEIAALVSAAPEAGR